MPRYVPPDLLAHLQENATTTCILMRIDPVTPGYASYGITSLDRDVVYDDGSGEMRYLAAVGMQPSTILQSNDLSVDNAEFPSLLPEYDIPIDEADINAGAYDYARFALYLVNYQDLGMGHVTLHAGTIGKVTIRQDGLSFVNELRGLSAQLKQSLCEKDSLTCRATFGSQPAGSSTPGPIERFPCGFDATSLIQSGTVSDVGLETNRTFTIGSFSMDENMLAPGIVKFTSGANAGRTYEVESNTDGGDVALAYETAFPIQVGDGVEYRRDCNKHARDEDKGCMSHWGADWVLHFRGEPDIPIGDAGKMETPGASREAILDAWRGILDFDD